MKFLFFAFKSLSRNPVRATLTLLGVGVAIFLFTGVVSLDQGMRRMLANSAGDDPLVVFDKYQAVHRSRSCQLPTRRKLPNFPSGRRPRRCSC